jgi:hypothetical protein
MKQAGYLNIGDMVLYGKFKNALGRIIGFSTNEKGDPTVEVQPMNSDGTEKKSKPKVLTMLKIRKKKAAIAERVALRYLRG